MKKIVQKTFKSCLDFVPRAVDFTPYEEAMTVISDFRQGKDLLIYEPVKIQFDGVFRDFDIQVLREAGLIDKLAKSAPIKLTLLDKQDIVMSATDVIDQLDLKQEVENKRQEYADAMDNLLKSQSAPAVPAVPADSIVQS